MYTHDSPYHRITVKDTGFLRILQFERNRQSSMYLDAPFETDMEYPGYLHLTLAVAPHATRTLIIGLGGGTVVKRMWRDYPEMRIDAVEIDPEVVAVAQQFFHLPEDDRIAIFVGDGREFLRTSAEKYDIVIVDAFDEDRVPQQLKTEEFMREVRGRLSRDGVVAYNFIGCMEGKHSKPFRSLYRTLSNVWRQVLLFTVDEGVLSEDCNLILLATDAQLSEEELLERIGSRVDGRVTVPCFDLYGNDLFRGKVRTADVPLLVDPQSDKRARKRA